jgi:hypothetical protein
MAIDSPPPLHRAFDAMNARTAPSSALAGRCSRRQKCSSLNESGALPALLDPAASGSHGESAASATLQK